MNTNAATFIDACVKLKSIMIERKKQYVWTRCPCCGGRLEARLVYVRRNKQAIRAKCIECGAAMME